MTLRIAYPHDRRSLEPRALKAREIWGLAGEVRRQVLGGRREVRLDIERVVRAAQRMLVNGSEMAAHWDLERRVRDGAGREALGVTEADPALPGALLISLNGELIAGRDYLKRSTLAHELGHALFDGPSMLRQAGQRAFAGVMPDAEDHEKPAPGGVDWREFRANEFMAALLTPRGLLQREVLRRAIALGLPVREAGEEHPVLGAGGDPVRVEELLLDLGERFGVSASFIEYRLQRYGLVR